MKLSMETSGNLQETSKHISNIGNFVEYADSNCTKLNFVGGKWIKIYRSWKVGKVLLIRKLHQFSAKKAPLRLTWWFLYGLLCWRIMNPCSYKILRGTARLIFLVFGDAWNFWKLLETNGKFHGNFRILLWSLLETETSNL